LVAANELGLQELISHLQSFLIENNENWINQSFSLIYQTSFDNDSFLILQNFCTELMSREPEKVFNSIDFNSISEKCLISLIQHDNTKMDDIKVWEHVLNWGIAQNPELPSDPSNYSKDDFNILKNTLQKCIPFIKFYNLTSEEFLNNVYPYKKIIPKELRENLVKYFLNPNNWNSINSTVKNPGGTNDNKGNNTTWNGINPTFVNPSGTNDNKKSIKKSEKLNNLSYLASLFAGTSIIQSGTSTDDTEEVFQESIPRQRQRASMPPYPVPQSPYDDPSIPRTPERRGRPESVYSFDDNPESTFPLYRNPSRAYSFDDNPGSTEPAGPRPLQRSTPGTSPRSRRGRRGR
jgi:hypothetical protein